jgi:hypothetical protein
VVPALPGPDKISTFKPLSNHVGEASFLQVLLEKLQLRFGLVRGSSEGSTRPLSAASPLNHTDHTGVPELSDGPLPQLCRFGVVFFKGPLV